MNCFGKTLKRLATAMAGLGMVAVSLGVSAAPAQAAGGDLNCILDTIDVTFQPPLSPTRQATTATGRGPLLLCSSPNGRYSRLTRATITGIGTAKFQPPIYASVTGKAQFKWNTGEVSDFTFDVNTDPLSPKFEAETTSGPLLGDTVLPTGPVVFVPKVDLLCGCVNGFTAADIAVNFA
ncbi:hypothetical protein [Streptomyces lavendulae]|uniref:hypothetical protein n=1 Tax=Streptomyces lavendulae TaxID=1914 RepID=UPI0034045276